ncbi:LOW QUALITY PROTEIN: axin-like [Choristoneura fumiferana]|uniref:LOW QUALITY PROTEIN: axin-like n=1 Tax=Choristoneura fumiferana TaxID=7141 RepID=UPI003D15526D
MSHTPVGGHPQGWDHKLADRSSLPPASGEEKAKSHSKHVFAQPQMSKQGASGGGAGAWRSETEGSSGSSAQSARSLASPPYMRWARSLHDLLEDAEGVRLFRKFVGGAGALHVDRLNFHFAVQGLRQEPDRDHHKIRQVVSAIYKFLRKSALAMPEELKARVKAALRDGAPLEKTVFDPMEQEVTRAITETTYQAFLRSEAYVSYVSAATQPLSSADASPPAPLPPPPREAGVGGLATLHEGLELAAGAGAAGAGPGAPARLTHDALLATQARRLHADQAPKHRAKSVYSAHVTYAGYCPASRQDSERASLSSGRADSDAVSLSGSSLDGLSARGGRERERRRPRLPGLDRQAVINKEQDTNMVIPRTQRMSAEALRVLPPAEFAPLLIEKLERVRREQDLKDRLERRLQEGDGEDASTLALPPQLVAAAIREKLQLDDDNDQDILDQHVSRVWSERTPGASPPGGRRRARPPPHPHPRARAPSALSADSGHCDASDLLPPPSHSRSFSKKAPTELTDSGVSVVSSGGSVPGACGPCEPRLLLWVAEGERRLHERGPSADRDKDDHRRRAPAQTRPRGKAEAHTVVVVSFLDEAVPYRFKVPAAPLTLRLFKDFLPRKGNYRYFFKTECADLDNTVIQEEVSNDSDTLPMFDGKVMARVKAIE